MMVSSWSIGGKTVESLYINNKEVQSIIRNSDGVVLYEKASGGHNYSLTFGQSSYTASMGSCTITCTLLDNGNPVSGETILITGSDGSQYTSITNQSGIATFNITQSYGTGLTFTASYDSVTDSCSILGDLWDSTVLYLGIHNLHNFSSYNTTPFTYTGDLLIDWGDGTTETYGGGRLMHRYSQDGDFLVRIKGNITQLNSSAFQGTPKNLTNVIIPSTVTTIGASCFRNLNLDSVVIPNTVTSLGTRCFQVSSILDYQLYWDTPPVKWSSTLMYTADDTIFTIPYGTTANYTAKNFPSEKLIERTV